MFSISIKQCRGALLVLVLGLFGIANADGPVNVSALPGGGGNVVIDTDITQGGSLGQRWGRAGGRSITYHVANPATFSALTFGVVQGTQPSLQFDGFVTPTPSGAEIMTYSPTQSDLGAGMARWTGAATLQLVSGTFPNLPTRFTMTVTRASGGAPVALQIDSSGPNPVASVLSTGDFVVNLLFEMQDVGNPSIFRPVLDYYDSLATPPGNPPASNNGPVTTGVSTGFYYTVAVVGMTLEEHDSHLQALFDDVNPKINNINDKINFLRTDWDGRIPAIQNRVGDVYNALNNNITPTLQQIQQQVQQLLGQGNGTGNLATKSDVQGVKEQLQGTLLMIAGLMPCPTPPQQGAAECAAAKKISDLSTQASVDAVKVDTTGILIGMNQANEKLRALELAVVDLQDALDNTASPALDVRAIQIDSNDPKKLRWLVKTTRDGVMVSASLSRFMTVRTPGAAVLNNVMGNAVIVQLAPGLHDVTLDLVKNVTDGVAYLFEASMPVAGGSPIQGSALLITEKKGASPF